MMYRLGSSRKVSGAAPDRGGFPGAIAPGCASSVPPWRCGLTGGSCRPRQHLLDVQEAVARMNRALEETRNAQATTALALKQSEADRTPGRNRQPPGRVGQQVPDRYLSQPGADRRWPGNQGGRPARSSAREPRHQLHRQHDVKGDLYNALGDTYYGLRLYEKAVVAHEKARDVRRADPRRQPPRHAREHEQTRPRLPERRADADAIKLHEETLKLRRKELARTTWTHSAA